MKKLVLILPELANIEVFDPTNPPKYIGIFSKAALIRYVVVWTDEGYYPIESHSPLKPDMISKGKTHFEKNLSNFLSMYYNRPDIYEVYSFDTKEQLWLWTLGIEVKPNENISITTNK